ncbi:uncharacterized protein LOC133368936 [Rhineura floridana]|uniref:uncharacterized protein LOC133368936 n=1 Tax=Rhineura floridana TaxID=261503 RepID=UPI002AC85F62|nr:uncharacterized protein LOC133368936 [Rhineura floridana]
MKRPAAAGAAVREVLQDYLAFYRAHWAVGKLLICNEGALKSRVRRLLAADPCLAGASGKFDVYSIAESCLRMNREQGGVVFRKLIQALEFLELICVNLFLSPWRKEIKSLKTFTGNFVYYVRSALPEGIMVKVLEEIGYIATTATEFSLARKLNEETEQAAFEIFLARIECEDLVEIAEDVRDSDLVDILQKKRAQKHWCDAESNLDRNPRPSQRKECTIKGGRNETLSPQQTHLTHSKLAFEVVENSRCQNEVGVKLTAEEPQPAASKFTREQNRSQSQADALADSCTKSSDSEDFLIKYSDIVIGQKPLHLADLPPKASEDETQNTGLIGSRQGPPANEPWSLELLSPDASGPQALAILNDVALEGKVPYGYQAQESSREMTESKICDAMSCLTIHGSDPTDQPKELKGNTIQHSNKFAACSFSSKEVVCHLSSASKEEDGIEKLMYPVEETAQPELITSKRGIKEFDRSKTKLADQPGEDREGFNVDLYTSELFCNIAGCNCPTVGLSYNRLVVGNPGLHEAGEYFRHIGEPPSSSCITSPEACYHGGTPADIQCRGEECNLNSSFVGFDTCVVPLNETNPEGYVVINKDD